MGPLMLCMEKTPEIENVICLTGQHREMLDRVMEDYGLRAKYDLNIMRHGQSLAGITTRILEQMEGVLREERPDVVLVHGDTSTSFAAALSAFYQRIPVGHVEAGLRSFDRNSPFPEEMNRRLTDQIAQLYFAPTEVSRRCLAQENITENVFVTGNTVVDAVARDVRDSYVFHDPVMRRVYPSGRRCILITAHRRENLGTPLRAICREIRSLAEALPEFALLYPVHPNPAVREPVEALLHGVPNVYLLPPVDVTDMHNAIARSFLVLTDSGGLQEEACACHIPVLVMRTETERTEGVEAGMVRLVGNGAGIADAVLALVRDEAAYRTMLLAENPFGDGHASERIVECLLKWYACRRRAESACG